MHVYEQFEKMTSNISLMGEKMDDEQDKAERDGGITQSKEQKLRLQLLSALADHIVDVEAVGGSKAIPYLQVMMVCCTSA